MTKTTNITDNVNHPKHYQKAGMECIDVINAITSDLRGMEAFCVANAVKYLWRYSEKNGVEDIKKARWYIDYLIKLKENQP